MMKRLVPYLAAGVIGLGSAVALVQAQQPVGQPTSPAAVTALVAEVAAQQKKLSDNLTQMEEKLKVIEEDIRQTRIFARRGGGGGG